MKRLIARTSALALLILLPQLAHAASCCLSAAAFGVGRLRLGETWALGYSTRWAEIRGRWDADGEWIANPKSYREREWQHEVWGLTELADGVSGFLRLPYLINDRQSGAISRKGDGVGDIQAGTRWEWVPLRPGDEGPSVAATVSLTAPSGKSTDESDDPLGADVTGRGAWVPGMAVELEWTGPSAFFRTEAGATWPLPFRRADIHEWQQFGPGMQLAVLAGTEIAHESALSFLAGWEREADLLIGGNRVVGSAQSRWHLGPSLALSLDETWTLLARLDATLPWDGWGDNANGRLSGTLGIRHGY